MNWRDRIWQVLFPKQCPFCGKNIRWESRCCDACAEMLRKVKFQNGSIKETYPLAGIFPVFAYQDGVAYAIRQMKFQNHPAIARHLAVYAAEILPENIAFDAIVPIPMHRRNVWKRGYNQAALLAKFISQDSSIPMKEMLVKVRKTRPQHTLNARERRRNLEGAYALSKAAKVSGQTLLLCDDVVTTGSTLREAAKVLLNDGAKAVYAVVIASASLKDENPATDL